MCSFRWPKVSWSTPRARATTSPPLEEDSQASNLEICGVCVQRAGGRLVHVMSDPVSCLWLNLCHDFFFQRSHSLSHFRQCWRAQLQGWWLQQHTKHPYRLRKAGVKIFKSIIFSGQFGRGDDSTGWLLSWICLKSRRLYFKIPNKLWIAWIFINSICLRK